MSREAIDYFFQHLTDEFIPLARIGVEFLSEAAKSERIKERQQQRFEMVRQFYCWLPSAGAREVRPTSTSSRRRADDGAQRRHPDPVRGWPASINLQTLKAAYVNFLNCGLAGPTSSLFTPLAAVASNGSTPRNGTHDNGENQP
jgi:hypothetical protein